MDSLNAFNETPMQSELGNPIHPLFAKDRWCREAEMLKDQTTEIWQKKTTSQQLQTEYYTCLEATQTHMLKPTASRLIWTNDHKYYSFKSEHNTWRKGTCQREQYPTDTRSEGS